ncbi:hypothetical protein K7W42_20310 [Deinococcus sp. HMF7604]|uniref:hypothetical protein n=1 Tax=Deinococcus betulae TaxID=2873312 RepID=UPI001CC9D541|nr:hypothetical protein [Deinococcus betulae]MBZ9753183.1 hypothetical protein [Deinococcus betulae]
MRRVTGLPGTYGVGGKSYGPFTPSEDQPWTEVPDALVLALNLELHDSDPLLLDERAAQAQAAATLAEQDAQAGVEIQKLLDTNAGLKADLDAAQRERADVQQQLAHVQGQNVKLAEGFELARQEHETAKAAWGTEHTTLTDQAALNTGRLAGLEGDLREARALIDSINADREQLNAQLEQAHNAPQAAPAPLTLPDTLRDQIAGLKGVSVRQADEVMDLVKAALAPAPAGNQTA